MATFYLSQELLEKSYSSLKSIADNPLEADSGKQAGERTSAIRYFFATARLLQKDGTDSVDLSPFNTEKRDEFTAAVGEVVQLGTYNSYTNNFSAEFKDLKGFGVSNNFLTTRLNKNGPNPGRPAPLIQIDSRRVKLFPDWNKNLIDIFNLNKYHLPLAVWLMRNISIVPTVTTANQIADFLLTKLTERYGEVAKIFGTVADLTSYLENNKKLVSETPFDGNQLKDKLQKEEKAKSNEISAIPDVLISGIDENDDCYPVYQKVKRAIDNGRRNFLFFGAPGTGKTYNAKKIAIAIAGGDTAKLSVLQFHPSMSYDDFMEGYAPSLTEDSSLKYLIEKKHFLNICENARHDQDNYYVILIDEISRGDPSRVFGEALTYMEEDYRDEDFSLLYSADITSVPSNLIIIGTTNPYDRSISELDDAFIRRFYMLEFSPSEEVLNEYIEKKGIPKDLKIKILRIFNLINDALPYGFGHAQLFNISDAETLQEVWTSKIKFLVGRSLQFQIDEFKELVESVEALFAQKNKTKTEE
jgi:5-methylcytosine-specific restriction protein B